MLPDMRTKARLFGRSAPIQSWAQDASGGEIDLIRAAAALNGTKRKR